MKLFDMKRLVCFALFFLLLFSSCAAPASGVTPTPNPPPDTSPEITAGYTETQEPTDQHHWIGICRRYDEGTRTLTFSGVGLFPFGMEDSDEWNKVKYDWDDLAEVAETLVFEEGIMVIPDGAFCGFSHVTEVRLPSTLISIGEYAFSQCAMEEITIPDAVEEIGCGAFSDCTHLRTCDIWGNISVLEPLTFDGCTALQSVWFMGESLIELRKDCFRGCDQVNMLVIPSSVNKLEDVGTGGIRVLVFEGKPPKLTQDPATGEYFTGFSNLMTVYYPEGSEKWQEIAEHCRQDITWIEGIPEDGE